MYPEDLIPLDMAEEELLLQVSEEGFISWCPVCGLRQQIYERFHNMACIMCGGGRWYLDAWRSNINALQQYICSLKTSSP